MKFAMEVMELLEAYPLRSFRVVELVRHATRGRALEARERAAARKAVQRVLDAFIDTGLVVVVVRATTPGTYAEYGMAQDWSEAPAARPARRESAFHAAA
ncbi:hypothetical protein [Bordetella genomosp. 1]|nr:hypothetical protein [Bordetella genomosp. 1]